MADPKRLNANDAYDIIERSLITQGHRDWRITIAITNPGGLTAHQTVDAVRIDHGMDWTAGQLILQPAMPLTWLTAEQVADITKSVRAGGSWHAYEREKKLHARIKELEAALAVKGEA